MPLISEILKDSLVQQIGHELSNGNFYMRIAAFLHSKGLKNIAKHFEDQIAEEQEHSRIIYKLLTDLGEDFNIPEIDSVDVGFETFLDLATAYLQREEETTVSLKEIKNQASEENGSGCSVVEVAMISMIEKQQAELDEATTLMDKAILFKEWWQVGLYDSALGG